MTTPARTLTDLRRLLPQQGFAKVLREAEFLGLPLDSAIETDHTRSELEAHFLGLCRRRRIPVPEVNVRIGGYVVDFLWRVPRLVVEVDGFRSHGTRSAFEADRRRDAELKLLGYEVVRFTWRRLAREPKEVAEVLRALLADR